MLSHRRFSGKEKMCLLMNSSSKFRCMIPAALSLIIQICFTPALHSEKYNPVIIEVRKYDFRVAKKRPLEDIMIDKYGLVKIKCNQSTGNLLTVANTGQIYNLNPSDNLHIVKKYNEAQGTVTDISFSEDFRYFCSVSLDRHLRIYSLAENEMVREEFLYQRLEKCQFSPEAFDFEVLEIEDEEAEEQETETQATPQLFRDKLEKAGGKLTHNYIKLKYERRHTNEKTKI